MFTSRLRRALAAGALLLAGGSGLLLGLPHAGTPAQAAAIATPAATPAPGCRVQWGTDSALGPAQDPDPGFAAHLPNGPDPRFLPGLPAPDPGFTAPFTPTCQ